MKKIHINKTIISLIIFGVVQSASVIGVLIFNYFNGDNELRNYFNGEHFLLFVILAVVFINSFLTIKDVTILNKHSSQYEILMDSMRQVENLNNTLRSQRHDFMNHLQVVHGLIEMEEYEESKIYIEKLFEDIQKVNNFLKTSNPAVNALLQAKILAAEKNKVKVMLNIKSRLKDIKIPSWELCRVLGNIIDNALYALNSIEGEKIIHIEIFENLNKYGFRIRNNGPEINANIIEAIFNPGFTTKGNDGQGMGLYICQEILSEYEGGITVTSNKDNTEFEGWFI